MTDIQNKLFVFMLCVMVGGCVCVCRVVAYFDLYGTSFKYRYLLVLYLDILVMVHTNLDLDI